MKKALAVAILILLSIACSQTASTAVPTRTPAQILSEASDAMLVIKSARFIIAREGDPVVISAATGMAFLEATGEYQAPDRVSAVSKVTLMSAVFEIQMYWLPEGDYISNPLTQQVEAAPAGMGIDGAALFAPEGIPAVLKTGIQNPVRIGDETVEDVPAIRIQGEVDGAMLSPLMAGALQSGTLYPVDVWVEKSSWNLVRFHIAEPDGSGWMIDLYDINADIEVQLPR